MSAAVSLPLPPPPLELVVRGREKKTVAYVCPSCGAVFTTYTFGRDAAAEQAAKHLASTHCHRFCACGQPIGKSRSRCDACWLEHLAASEEKVFSAAKKVRLEDYPTQPVYWNNEGDGFFTSIDEVLDRCEEEGLEIPKYVWAAKEVPFALNADYLIDRAIEDHGEDVRDELADKELQSLLDQWCRRQDVKSWQPDYTTAVLLHPED